MKENIIVSIVFICLLLISFLLITSIERDFNKREEWLKNATVQEVRNHAYKSCIVYSSSNNLKECDNLLTNF